MPKNKITKIIVSILLFILLITILSQVASATKFDISTKFEGTNDKSEASKNIANIISSAITVLQVFGAGIGIIMVIVIGVQFVWGAPVQRAEFTKKIRIYVLGVILIFSATALLQIVKKFVVVNINSKTTNTFT